METLTVNLGERSYPIHVATGALERAGDLLRQAGMRGKVAVVSNPTVAQLYLDPLNEALRRSGFEVVPVLVPDGEEHKNLQSLAAIYDKLIAERLERKSCIVALGGGVIGDLAGLAAATYLRGIPYVQIPTTLLAQVDSSVGGKTAINHAMGKNLIGAFYQPKLVLIDVAVLASLPKRELIAGIAEVIKYGIIDDPALFSLLEREIGAVTAVNKQILARVVATSCAIKARVVEADEREEDYRAVLNFGHTVGHALEAATGYKRFLHGEAVGVGLVKATALSVDQRVCDAATLQRVTALVQKAGLPVDIPPEVSSESLIRAMEIDKKVAGGKIKFIMCEAIGKTRFHWLKPDEVLRGLGR
ncbi:MAG TPA: 3-dehydroquinate synthase [Candidatus Binatia bacterium]|nr:3-dehydroquinate synthase [Candidatus Binatia bacterium]